MLTSHKLFAASVVSVTLWAGVLAAPARIESKRGDKGQVNDPRFAGICNPGCPDVSQGTVSIFSCLVADQHIRRDASASASPGPQHNLNLLVRILVTSASLAQHRQDDSIYMTMFSTAMLSQHFLSTRCRFMLHLAACTSSAYAHPAQE